MVGNADATGFLSGAMQGFEAAGIDISSNASIQGLAQLANSATAAAVFMGRLRFELRTNRLKAECSTAELATLCPIGQSRKYHVNFPYFDGP